MNGFHPIPNSEGEVGVMSEVSPPGQMRWPPDRETQEVFLRLLRENSTFGTGAGVGGGGAKTATFVVGPSSNTDSSTYDYVTDGTADDVQIQAAIDALPTNGGSVVLREGTYTLSSEVVVTTQGVKISGVGRGTVVQHASTPPSQLLRWNGASANHGAIENIYFNGANTVSVSNGIQSNGADMVIRNCQFLDFTGTCIAANMASELEEGVIDSCYFENWDSGNTGLYYAIDSFYGSITNCFFKNSNVSISYLNGFTNTHKLTNCVFVMPASYNFICLLASNGSGIISNNTFIVGNNAGSGCIVISGGSQQIVSNNIIYFGSSPNVSAIAIANTDTVIGNFIFRAGRAIDTTGAGRVFVNSNKISTTLGHSIVVDTGNAIISDNIIEDGGTATTNTYSGIELSGSNDHCIISGNRIRSNASNKLKYGINEQASCDANIIIGNSITGVMTESIHIVGANTQIGFNIAD